MEILGLIEIPWWILLPLAVLLSLYGYTTYKQNHFQRRGIPIGPKPVPFLGIIPYFRKKGWKYQDAEFVQKFGKCFGVYTGNRPSLVISDPDMIRHILVKEFSKFTDRPRMLPSNELTRNSLTNADGEHWKFLRATLSPTFSTRKLKDMSPLLRSCMDQLLNIIEDKLQESDTINLQKLYYAFTMDTICSTAFGVDVDCQRNPENEFAKHAYKMMNFKPGTAFKFFLAVMFPDFEFIYKYLFRGGPMTGSDSVDFFKKALKSIIDDRRANKTVRSDLLQVMINSHKDSDDPDLETDEKTFAEYRKRGMTDDEIVMNSLIFLLAGYETTATTLTWVSYSLATNPDVQDKLLEEIDRETGKEEPSYETVFNMQYLDMVVSETLRLYPPAVRTNRKASEDVEICGVPIQKGTDCTFPVYAIHYLPEFWPDPETFDPERFSPENKHKIVPYTYLPFGLGPRNCVGMRLAQLSLKMTLVKILQRYKLHRTDSVKVPPELTNKSPFLKLDSLELRLEKRI